MNYFSIIKKISYYCLNDYKKMNVINKYLPFCLKAEKIIPSFIILKLLTFSGFIAYMMNR